MRLNGECECAKTMIEIHKQMTERKNHIGYVCFFKYEYEHKTNNAFDWPLAIGHRSSVLLFIYSIFNFGSHLKIASNECKWRDARTPYSDDWVRAATAQILTLFRSTFRLTILCYCYSFSLLLFFFCRAYFIFDCILSSGCVLVMFFIRSTFVTPSTRHR